MTEGPFHPLLLTADEVASLSSLLDDVIATRVGRVPGAVETLRAALDRAAAGELQTHTNLPVHAARAMQRHPKYGTALPVCDVDALGVVTADRNLVDCSACVALLDEAARHPCPNPRCSDGMVERTATPDEVDFGCELGVAYDPCPACNPDSTEGTTTRMQRLGREAVDRAAEHYADQSHVLRNVDDAVRLGVPAELLDAEVGVPIVRGLDQYDRPAQT